MNAISILSAFSFNILCEDSARLLKEGYFYLRGQALNFSIEGIFGDISELQQAGICQYWYILTYMRIKEAVSQKIWY